MDDDDLLTPSEVAAIFKVDPKTVSRWARSGKLTSFRTLGGHRRFSRKQVNQLIKGSAECSSDSS